MRFRWVALVAAMGAALGAPVAAFAALSVTPITWNVVGLDSNTPATGPRNFPVGERICSTTASGPVTATLAWDSANPYIAIRPGTLNPVTVGPLAPGGCADVYFEVEIAANAAAFDTTRRFHVTATDGAATASSPTPRELYVEHLVSQNRNGITAIKLNGTTIPAGGTMTLMVGNTYEIELDGFTATQGYNQLESFINLSNAVFQVLAVTSTYSAGAGGNTLYANACVWDPVPGSPNYNTCIGPDLKAGGTVVIKYTVRIVAGAGTQQTLNTLLYDFSGSSFHYNADYATGARIASIVSPASVGITKTFSPRAIAPNGTSALTFRITNPTTETFTAVNFADTLAGGLKVAATPSVTTTNCGAGAFSPALAANATQLNFQGATLAPNSTCTITVNVTAPAGTYPNTTGHLFINGTTDTGNSASDTLTAATAPACVAGQTLATWNFTNSTTASAPEVASKASNVSLASTFTNVTAPTLDASTGNPAPSWAGRNWAKTGTITGTTAPYFQFQVDTSKYSNVQVSVGYRADSSWAAAPGSTVYVWSSTDNATYTAVTSAADLDQTWRSTGAKAVAATGGASTYFRINAVGANNSNSFMQVDNVTITGCGVPAPAPTIAKSFLANPAVVNGTSTLQFTLNNNAVGNVALTGVAFSDVLPASLTVGDSTSAACGGTLTTTAATRTIALAGGALAAGGNCIIPVLIGATAVGQYDNVTGYISASESGASTNYATATLTVIAPPRLTKSFTPASVSTGGTSTLAFAVVNPNPLTPLTAVAFSDVLPSGLAVTNASGPACGGTYTVTAGTRTIALTGGALAANASCTFGVPVVGGTAGVFTNTTGTVSAFETGPGATATAELSVADALPLLGLGKQVSTDGTHFTKSVAIAPPQSVWWRFTISNDGEVPLDGVSVSDSFAAMGSCTPALPSTLLVGEQASCVVGPTNVPATPTPNPFINTATATTTTYTPPTPVTAQANFGTKALTLDKTAIETYFAAAGDVLHYSYLVTNTGGYPLAGPLSVSDDRGAVTCPLLTSINEMDDYLAPGETATCSATYVVTAADVSAGFVTNTAVATVGAVQSAPDSVTIPRAANLSATKTNNVGGSTATGSAFTWTITVANAAGGGSATFANGQALLKDDLPSAGATYAVGTVGTTGGASGTAACAVAANTLTCTANGAVTLPAGATLVVPVMVTTTASGTLANPRSGGVCAADPDNVIPESGEGDNACADTVNVGGPPPVTADLAVVKSRTSGGVTPGATISYSIVVTNNGPAAVTGAKVADTLPAALTGATWTCAASAGASCSGSGSGSINDTAVNLPAGATATYALTATLAANATGSLANTATVTPPAGTTDPTPGNNSSTVTDSIQPSADLAITKTNGVASVTPGTSVTYTITATNNGPSVANGATVTDVLPAALSSAAWTCAAAGGATCTASGSGNLADTVNLPVGGSVAYTIAATLAANATGTLANTATVAAPAGTNDPTPGNNSATDSDPIVANVGLAVTKDDGSLSYTPGGSATYTVGVTNSGPSVATNLSLTDTLPAGVTLSAGASCTPTGNATCGTLTGAIGASAVGITGATLGISAGDKLLVTIPVAFASSLTTDPLVNGVTVTDAASGQSANASDSDARTPQVTIAVAKSDGSASYTPGGSATYQVTVTNTGLSDAVDVAVTDALPAGVTLTAAPSCVATGLATCGTVTGAAGGSAFGAANATVPAGGGSTLVFSLPVAYAANLLADPLVNTAQATDVATGATGSASDSDTRSASVTLALTKDDGTAFYTPGGTATYTITVRNNGVSAATGVTVSDALPAGVTLTAAPTCTPGGSASCGTVTGSAGGTSLGTTGAVVPAGAGNLLTFSVPVQFAANLADDPLINTVSATDTDSNATGSASDSDVRLASGALAVSKSDGSATYTPGGTATYTIVVTNAGPSNASAVTVSDPLPGGVTLTGTPTCTPAGAATCGTVTGAAGGNSVGTTGATLAAGAGHSLTFTVPVAFAPGLTTTPLVNTVSVSSPDDPSPVTASDSDTLASGADLAITKTDGVTAVTAGTGVTYTIVATNAGPSNVTGASVADTLPGVLTGATWTCVASAGASCTATGSGSISDTVTLAVGAAVTYTVNATLSLAASGTLSNTATIAAPAGVTDPVPGNNSATDSDTIVAPQADLAITKTDGTTSVTAGGTVIYTIVASNAGPAAVGGATVADTLPAGLSNATWTCAPSGGATCAASGTGSIVDVVSLPVGGTATYTLSATLAANATGSLSNTATIAAPSGVVDPNPANNQATDTNTIVVPVQTANLGITKTDGLTTVSPGQRVTYTVVVSNAGPNAANGATVADVLPAALSGATWTCVAAGGATCTSAGSGNLADTVTVPVGGTATYTISATLAATATGTLANTATVTPPAGVLDPVPGNNTATDNDTVVPLQANLLITKTDGVVSVTTGQALTYTIVVANAGPNAAIGAKVDDTLPAALTGATWTCAGVGGGTCTAAGTGSIHDTVNLPVNATLTYTLKATVAANAAGALVNTAMVGVPPGMVDPTPANNTATDTDAIGGAAADVTITKTDGLTTVTPGQKVTYTIVAGNAGPQAVTGATISDPLPAALGGATWTCVVAGGATCTPAGSGGLQDTVNLPVGGTATYTLTATLSASATGTLVNAATVAPPAGVVDPNPGNNTATDTDAIAGGTGLTLGKSDGSTTYTPGGAAIYTIVVGNTGAANATGITVSDPLPAGVTLTAVPACTATGDATCGTVTGTVGGNAAGVTGASIAAGPANGLTLKVPVQFAASLAISPLVNTAVVKDAAGGTASAADSNVIAAAVASVKVVKTGPATVSAGGTITWSIAIDNAGPAAADGTTFRDPLPAGVTNVIAGCGGATGGAVCGNVGFASGVVSGIVAKLPAGGHVVVTITATAPTTGGALNNTVTVSLPDGMVNSNPGTLTSSAATTVPGGGGNPAEPIPVDNGWALALLALLLGGVGVAASRGRIVTRHLR